MHTLTVVGDEHDKVPAATPLPPLTASNDAAARRASQSLSSLVDQHLPTVQLLNEAMNASLRIKQTR